MRWAKPGADSAAVARDLDDCRASTLARAGPRAPVVGTQQAPMTDRGPSPSRSASSANDRFIAEHEDVRVCMLRRGYQLQPAS
jgi:hypothetical protein